MSSKVTYRQQFTRCGKQRCRKCREGAGHGPYWYAYWSEKGRTVSKYIGTHLPKHIEAERLQAAQEQNEESSANTSPTLSTPQLRVYLLGQFRVEHLIDGEWRAVDSRTWHRRRARALLGCLLSSPGRRLGREQVMELLWPDLDIDLAANRLNGAVHELRQILEPEIERPAASRLLRLEREVLELAAASQIWVDAEEFERLLKEAERTTDPTRSEHLLEEAAALYRGSYLLEELYSEWATPRRDALQRAWVGLLLNLANLRAERGAFVSAIETLDKLRVADPTNETALQRLMILLTQLDRRGEALQIYQQHVKMLRRDYEGEPLPETTELYEALRKGHMPTLYSKAIREQPAPPPELPTPKDAKPSAPVVTFTRPAFQVGRHNQSPLIGREQELATMRQVLLALETVQPGDPSPEAQNVSTSEQRFPVPTASRTKYTHFLLLKGETGIGKTRLAEELSLEAYTRGWTVAWSRSYEQEGAIPYRPWTELLRTLLQSTATSVEALQSLAPTGSPPLSHASPLKLERLSALLPELALQSSGQAVRLASAVLHEQERLHLWEATLGLLEVLASIQPLLLVLDDLHWADESSIELLTYLTHHLHGRRVLLVGTCRDGELPPQHKLRILMADLQREQTIVVVPVLPLTHSQIRSLVAHLPEDMVRNIQTQASGNPFFAEELARYVGGTGGDGALLIPFPLTTTGRPQPAATLAQQTDHLPHPVRTLPDAIAAVLERRLSRLSGGCQILLGKAAVLGGSFELSQLLPMTSEHDEDSVLDLLEEALNAGLLTEEGTGAHITYHFWHPLIISHLYSRLSAARRAQLHRKAADAIKSAHVTQPEKVAATIVYHLSRGGGDPMTIAHYAELAGNQAYSLGGYAEAQRYYLHVIRALTGPSEVSTTQEREVQIQHINAQTFAQSSSLDLLHVSRLLERIAECSIIMGNSEAARYLYECILDLRTSEHFQRQVYSATGSEEQRRQEAQIQALLWREIGNTWAATGDYEQAYSCYGRGKEVMLKAGIQSGAAWACVHLQYGALLRLEGNYHEARRYLQEALAMLEQIEQQSSQQEESERLPHHPVPENFRRIYIPVQKELQTRTERALLGDPLEIAYAHERLGIVAASLGQLTDALAHMHIALTMYERSELISEMARVCGNLGAAYITRGEHEAARTYLHRSLDLAKRGGDLPNMAFIMLNLGDVAQRSGNLLEAENWFQQSIELAERIHDREGISWCACLLAAVQQDLGKLQEATASILRALTIGRSIKSARCICFALIGLADLRITQAVAAQVLDSTFAGQPERQHHLLRRAQATVERAIALEGMEVENSIDGRYLLAKVSFLLGDEERALQIAEQTLIEAQEHEMTRTSGRIYRLLGLILATRGNEQQAFERFEQALQVSREREFRLDYARALYSYGLVLAQRGALEAASKKNGRQTGKRSADQMGIQRGLLYLDEARTLFTECHATIDLALVEKTLSQYV